MADKFENHQNTVIIKCDILLIFQPNWTFLIGKLAILERMDTLKCMLDAITFPSEYVTILIYGLQMW